MRAALRTRHCSLRTEKAYVGWIRRHIVFHGKRHPSEMSAGFEVWGTEPEALRYDGLAAVEFHMALHLGEAPPNNTLQRTGARVARPGR